MAIADSEYRISMQANELLECFVSGLDDIILKIAISRAKERPSIKSGAVRVEPDDIRFAAEYVQRSLEALEGLPPAVAVDIREANECLNQKCRQKAKAM